MMTPLLSAAGRTLPAILLLILIGCQRNEIQVTLASDSPPRWELEILGFSPSDRVYLNSQFRKAYPDHLWLIVDLRLTPPEPRCALQFADIALVHKEQEFHPETVRPFPVDHPLHFPQNFVGYYDSTGVLQWQWESGELSFELTTPCQLSLLYDVPRSARRLTLRFPTSYKNISPPPPAEFQPMDEPPVPVGGMAALMERLIFPPSAINAGKQGTVIVETEIGSDGQVRTAHIINSFGSPECDQAALDAVHSVKWQPAIYQGENVTARIRIPFRFRP